MTFYRALCEDIFDALGHDGALRHAYRVYLWRRARGLVHLSLSETDPPAAGAELYSEFQASVGSKRASELNAEIARRSLERVRGLRS